MDLQARARRDYASCFSRLHKCWDEIGLDEDERCARQDEVMQHVRRLLDNIAAQEERSRDEILKNIELNKRQLQHLAAELGQPSPQLAEENERAPLVQLDSTLEEMVDELKEEKERRLESLVQLESRLEMLQTSLSLEKSESDLNADNISLARIAELENKVSDYEQELQQRQAEVEPMLREVREMWEELEQQPSTSFEQSVADGLQHFVLSQNNIFTLRNLHASVSETVESKKTEMTQLWHDIRTLWKRLDVTAEEKSEFKAGVVGLGPMAFSTLETEHDRLLELRQQNMRSFIIAAREELIIAWDRCYIGEEERDDFTALFDSHYNEALLERHEAELKRVNDYYEKHKELLRLVERREAIDQKINEFENAASDLDRLSNRGGKLLREEKFRKAAAKEVPKLEREIKTQVAEWEEEHDCTFTVNGVPYVEDLESRKANSRRNKEEKKIQRQKAKAEQIEAEMLYGCQPKTPKRRPAAGTASSTQRSARKPLTTPSRTTSARTPKASATKARTAAPYSSKSSKKNLARVALADCNKGQDSHSGYQRRALFDGVEVEMEAVNPEMSRLHHPTPSDFDAFKQDLGRNNHRSSHIGSY